MVEVRVQRLCRTHVSVLLVRQLQLLVLVRQLGPVLDAHLQLVLHPDGRHQHRHQPQALGTTCLYVCK